MLRAEKGASGWPSPKPIPGVVEVANKYVDTHHVRLAGKPVIEVLFKRFEAALSAAGYLAMGGQIIDATIVAAPKQRNTDGEKCDIKEGRIPPEWVQKPARLRQAERRWGGFRLQEPCWHRSKGAATDASLGRHAPFVAEWGSPPRNSASPNWRQWFGQWSGRM
jgi:hypothetical protein